jgi:two-component system cell cycle response regulator
MTSDQLRRIWQPYQQINDDFTGQVPGVGLGLAMVAQICWAAGGICRVENRPDGPGITVELELPLGVEPSPAERDAS